MADKTPLESFLIDQYRPKVDAGLGAEATIAELGRRIADKLKPEADSIGINTPPVIGLYGEWGSGKTFWMEQIRWHVLLEHYFTSVETEKGYTKPSSYLDTGQWNFAFQPSQDTRIIPIFFNAWRFEKEEHLIIPLLKTVSTELKQFADKESKTSSWYQRLGYAARDFSVSVAAMTYNLTKEFESDLLKAGLFGIAPDGSIIKALEESQQTKENWDKKFNTTINNLDLYTSQLDSSYFDFHDQLKQILTDNKQKIRLLFLIDDLDRCLPEKAVEMLESIKLFLEVEGTAFVVAVDDEVVERGIAHRYKAYKKGGDLPITGHEYLEKIITLPVRLDRSDDRDIFKFIEARGLSNLQSLNENETERDNSIASSHSESNKPDSIKNILKHIPNVPRKIIRLDEMFGLKLDTLDQQLRESLTHDNKLALLRLTAIQLFAPELYRVGQRGQPRVLGYVQDLKSRAEKDPDNLVWGDFAGHQSYLRQQINKTSATTIGLSQLQASEEATNNEPGNNNNQSSDDRNTIEKSYLPVLEALNAAKKHRSGFDPSQFLEDWSAADCKYWEDFFGHKNTIIGDDKVDATDDQPTSDTLSATHEREKWRYHIADRQIATFISALSSSSESDWETIANEVGIKRLDSDFAKQLSRELDSQFSRLSPEAKLNWLQTNGVLFDAEGFKLLAETLASDSGTLNDGDANDFPAQWGDLEAMRVVFLDQDNYSPATRLIAGDFIGYLEFGTEEDTALDHTKMATK